MKEQDEFKGMAHLASEADVGICNTPDTLDGCQDLIKGAPPLPHEVCNGQGGTSRDALRAMQQYPATSRFGSLPIAHFLSA